MTQRENKIQQMSEILSECEKILNELEISLEKYELMQTNFKKLCRYYWSKSYLNDIDFDRAGRISSDINSGALSEDGIYNAVLQSKELAKNMKKLSTKILTSYPYN